VNVIKLLHGTFLERKINQFVTNGGYELYLLIVYISDGEFISPNKIICYKNYRIITECTEIYLLIVYISDGEFK